MADTNKRWENFKSQVLLWKNAHCDEYFDFAEKMDKADGKGFIAMAQFMNKQLPELMSAWERRWRDDTPCDNMDELNSIVLSSGILKSWLAEIEVGDASSANDAGGSKSSKRTFHKSSAKNIGALAISWIIYGQMFETVIRQYEKLRQSKHIGYFQKHVIIPLLAKRAILASIKNGYRTQRDWDMYFKIAKAYKEDVAVAETVWQEIKKGITDGSELAILEEANYALQDRHSTGRKRAKFRPLTEYLTCEDEGTKQAVLSVIRKYIEQNNAGIPIALTFVALRELGILADVNNNVEYYYALALQFPDFKDLRSESSCKHALGEAQRVQKIYKDGRQCDGRLHEDDKYAPLYSTLLKRLKEAIAQ